MPHTTNQSSAMHRVKKYVKAMRRYTGNTTVLIFIALVLVACGIGVHLFRERLAVFVWNTSHSGFAARMLDSHNAVLYRDIGDYYFSGDHYDIQRAKWYFEKAVAADERVQLAHYQLARVHFVEGDFNATMREINREIELYPEYKRSHYMRGLVYGYTDDLDSAISDFQEFLKWKPNSWAAHNDLVWIYFRKGDFVNAEKYAREGLMFVPCNPWLGNSLGAALLNLGRYEEAKKYLLEAKAGFGSMNPEKWGRAYPGNSPEIDNEGLAATQRSVDANIALVQKELGDPGEIPDGVRCMP